MPELPWEKWYPTNWAGETGLRLCSTSTRGIWFELLNTMMLRQTASMTASLPSFAILLFCKVDEMELAVDELRREGVADITMANGSITITNRKRLREYRIKELRRNAGSKGAETRWHSAIAKPSGADIAKRMAPSASASVYASSSLEDGGKGEGIDLLEMKSELDVLFRRKSGVCWKYEEERLLTELAGERGLELAQEFMELKAFHKKPENYFPQSVGALLENWSKTLDRARGYDARVGETHNTVDKRQVKEHIVGKLL